MRLASHGGHLASRICPPRRGAHCGLAQTYFADEDIFETLDDLDRKTSTSTARGR